MPQLDKKFTQFLMAPRGWPEEPVVSQAKKLKSAIQTEPESRLRVLSAPKLLPDAPGSPFTVPRD